MGFALRVRDGCRILVREERQVEERQVAVSFNNGPWILGWTPEIRYAQWQRRVSPEEAHLILFEAERI